MYPNKEEYTSSQAWEELILKYNIIDEVNKNGCFHIKSVQIKYFKEPRLMAKWDTSDSLPAVFKKNKINILADSRGSYVIGDFKLYKEIPELEEHISKMIRVEIPEYESIDINNISSEANAINVLILSRILDDFLGTAKNVSTFNGRMGTGTFSFSVNTFRNTKHTIKVSNAQCEIDGGFENDTSVVIMEAKNVVREDFHIRQLYYPYRLWEKKVEKPIRLVFSVYSNMIYRLFEYKFTDLENYSSIELVQMKNYSLQDTSITVKDLELVRSKVTIKTDDKQSENDAPFIQADSFDRVVSIMENLYGNNMTSLQISKLMDFEPRQSDYYFNAGKYLRLFKKIIEDEQTVVTLTLIGKSICKMNYKERQLKLVQLILEHQIFAIFFDQIIKNGTMPNKDKITNGMRELKVCNEGQIVRRASSVLGWLRWIFQLTKL